MGNIQPNTSSSDNTIFSSLPFPKEDWPWIWAIENPEYLDWKLELKNDPKAIEERDRAQANLPVLISSPKDAGGGGGAANNKQDAKCSVYLSDAWGAHDIPHLTRLGITHVINVAGKHGQIKDPEAYRKANISTMTIDAEDEEGYPMLPRHWDTFQRYVQSAPIGSKIVVHCAAGLNRSGVLVAAHKLLTERRTVLEVVAHVRKQRGNLALCNQSFVAQLVALARANDLLGPEPGEPGCIVTEKAHNPPTFLSR